VKEANQSGITQLLPCYNLSDKLIQQAFERNPGDYTKPEIEGVKRYTRGKSLTPPNAPYASGSI